MVEFSEGETSSPLSNALRKKYRRLQVEREKFRCSNFLHIVNIVNILKNYIFYFKFLNHGRSFRYVTFVL